MYKKIKLKKIKIPKNFKKCCPSKQKLKHKLYLWYIGGFKELPPIIIDKNYVLKDGYCTYLIAQKMGIKKCKGYINTNQEIFLNGGYNLQKFLNKKKSICESEFISEKKIQTIGTDRYCIKFKCNKNNEVQNYIDELSMLLYEEQGKFPFSIQINNLHNGFVEIEFSVNDIIFLQDEISIFLLNQANLVDENLFNDYRFPSLLSEIDTISVVNAAVSIKKIS